MAAILSSLSAAQTQIRGPALIGPGLQIRGPGLLTAQCPDGVTDFTGRFNAAVAVNQGAVGILMADSDADIAMLTAMWPILSEPGWLVGTQTNAAALLQAYQDAGEDNPLRILIAHRVQDLAALSLKWHQCP